MLQVAGLNVSGQMKAVIQVDPPEVDDRSTPSTDDPWALPDFTDDGPKWSELDLKGKISRIAVGVGKALILIFLLYTFICSLDLMSSGFRLVGGKQAGRVFQETELLQNPVVGLMIGVIATVLVQSSSTSTSVVVTMVGSGLITVKNAIPIVMGANIGTSVTNTLVSFSQMGVRDEFRRAFAAATIHDMFNWLTVLVLLPLEAATGYLEILTGAIMDSRDWKQNKEANMDFLNKLTKPFTGLIIKLDKKVLEGIASNNPEAFNKSFIKRCCKYNGTDCLESCKFLFEPVSWSDSTIGGILLAMSFIALAFCLLSMVKVLKSSLKGRIAVVIKKLLNSETRFPYSILIGYLSILIGCGMTILLQSSSIFTSALTPLAGVGIVSLESMYPLTLGANLGTTTTSILAALAAPSNKLRDTLQIAFCHLFFNLSGILLYYPIPYLRFPIPLAKKLGNTTAKYRWFACFYLISMFFLFPILIFILSLAGGIALAVVTGSIFTFVVTIIVINILQKKRPSLLPESLRTWNWLPECLRSFDPMDRLVSKVFFCCVKPRSRHDGSALGLKANVSQVNIVESAKESHTLDGFENNGFIWAKTNGVSESTLL